MNFFTFRKNIPDLTDQAAVFVTGEEAYLRRSVVDVLVEEFDLEVHRCASDDTSPSRLDEHLKGHSFDQTSRLIRLTDRDGSFIKQHDEWVKNRISDGLEQNYLLIEAPGASKNLNIRSWLSKEAIHVECNTPEREQVHDWIRAFFHSEDLQIASETVSQLIDRVGLDLTLLRQEMEKLVLFARDEGQVMPGHLSEVVIDRSDMDFYEFTDAWLESNDEPVLKQIRRQLLRGESEVKITGGLLWAFRRLRSIIELSKIGFSPTQISRELGVQEWIVEKTLNRFRSLDVQELRGMAENFLKKDLLARTGEMDSELALELMVLNGLNELPVLENESW